MGADGDVHVEIAGLAAGTAGFAFAGQTDAGAVLDAGGDRDLQAALALHRTDAAADAAGVADHASAAMAGGAGGFDQEEALLGADPALALTGGAGFGAAALVVRAGAVAGLAGDASGEAQADFRAGERLGEVDLDGVAEIVAGPGTAAATTAATAISHEITEHLVEDVAQAAGAGEIEAAAERSATLLECGMAVTVVGGALLVVFQDFVSFADFLEPALGLLVARIAVRVKLHGELAICFFQIVGTGIPLDAEGGVIVLLGHLSPSTSQTKKSRPRAR